MARAINPRHLAWHAARARGDSVQQIAEASSVRHQAVSKAVARIERLIVAGKIEHVQRAVAPSVAATIDATDVKRHPYADSPDGLDVAPGKGQTSKDRQAAIREQKLAAICASLARGSSRTAAARAASISHATFYAWLQDPAILARVEQAEGQMINAVADRLFEIATKGPANSAWLAGLSIMERRSPDWIRPTQKIEQTTRVEGEINVRHILRSPESIAAASALEVALQAEDARRLPAHEGDVIEGELVPRLPE